MRNWAPEVASRARAGATLKLGRVSPPDLSFCRDFAAHGGVARSPEGFKAETDLVRMQKAGLLVLERDKVPPFAVITVTLSPAARERLAAPAGDAARPAEAVSADHAVPRSARPAAEGDLEQCRRGFEIARGLIGGLVKREFARAGEPDPEIEQRILTQISALQGPFG